VSDFYYILLALDDGRRRPSLIFGFKFFTTKIMVLLERSALKSCVPWWTCSMLGNVKLI